MRDHTPADEFRMLIEQIPPLERQQVVEGALDIGTRAPPGLCPLPGDGYVVATGIEILATTYPVGGSWRRKLRGRALVRCGLERSEAENLARARLEREFDVRETVIAIARPTIVPGLIVGWLLARGDTLVLCYTQEFLRRCGVQRLLMREVFHGGRPKYHVYEPRGSAEFLRRLGTERVR